MGLLERWDARNQRRMEELARRADRRRKRPHPFWRVLAVAILGFQGLLVAGAAIGFVTLLIKAEWKFAALAACVVLIGVVVLLADREMLRDRSNH
jgi:peptidoglycan/LPS O-acetylase OafA/YrhL